jgi:hypothetical protein
VWRACEPFNVRPPGVMSTWEACNLEVKMMLIAYSQIRQIEDAKRGF